MIVNGALERTRAKAVVTHFKLLSRKNHDELHSG